MTAYDDLVQRVACLTLDRSLVVELGCGEGKWKAACLSPWKGVDVAGCHDIRADMLDLNVWQAQSEGADTVMLMDSLEHVDREDGLWLIDNLVRLYPLVFAFVPIGDHRQDFGADHPNTHRAIYNFGDFARLGATEHAWPDFHGWRDKSPAAVLAVWKR